MYVIRERVHGGQREAVSAESVEWGGVHPTREAVNARLDLIAEMARRGAVEMLRPSGGRVLAKVRDDDGVYVRTWTVERAY